MSLQRSSLLERATWKPKQSHKKHTNLVSLKLNTYFFIQQFVILLTLCLNLSVLNVFLSFRYISVCVTSQTPPKSLKWSTKETNIYWEINIKDDYMVFILRAVLLTWNVHWNQHFHSKDQTSTAVSNWPFLLSLVISRSIHRFLTGKNLLSFRAVNYSISKFWHLWVFNLLLIKLILGPQN